MRTNRRAALGTTMLAVIVAVVVVIAAAAFVALSKQPSAAPQSKGPYTVAFEQTGACSPEFWGIPWSVTIGNTTKVQPPGNPLPLDNFSLSGTTNSSLSEITFSLADGTYSYRVSPSAEFFTPDSGTFAVSGSDVTIRIAYAGTSCITTTSEGGQPSTLNSTTSVDGLKLSAPFNSSAVQGRNFTVTAEVINTLPRVVNVNATSMTNPADGPCQQGLATGVKVYQGNYTVANVSQATELLLYNPSLTYTCPAVFTFHYSFSPNSDIATMQSVLGGSQVGKNTTGPIKESSVLSGYWSGSGQSYTFSVFPPGDYTMVVFDAWGQTVVDRFQVAPASGGPVEVVSVIGPIPPYNPGGPVVRVTLQNIGQVPITSLNASLPRYPGGPTVPYSFVFKVNSSSPLEPGQTAQATLTMIGFGFSTGQEFPLTVSGTLSNETEFSFIVQVQIVAPGQGAVTTSSESGLVGLCPNTGISSSFGTLTAGTSSPALLCVRLYYYSAAPLTLNLTSALSIQALQYNANGSVNYPRSFSGASNFTVVASQSQLTIGGPDNENEGATVAYGVTANSGSSGTYWLGFGSSGLTAYALTPQEPLSCGFYGELVAGSGQPNYARGFNGCITYTTTSESASATASSSAGLTVPGIPYSLMSGLLYFEIVGVTSSTG